MTVPQSQFTVSLPSQDNAVPPNALAAGEITSLVFEITAGTATADYSWPVPATAAPGSTVTATFASLSPPLKAVNGVSYTADVFAVDANGNGTKSASASWTQFAPVPAAPTNFSVG